MRGRMWLLVWHGGGLAKKKGLAHTHNNTPPANELILFFQKGWCDQTSKKAPEGGGFADPQHMSFKTVP